MVRRLAPLLAVALLALAACGPKADNDKPPETGDVAVARVDGQTIWASDVKREAIAQGRIGEGLAWLGSTAKTEAPGSVPRVAARKPPQPIIASARNRSDGLTGAAPPGRCAGSCPSASRRRRGGARRRARRPASRSGCR